MRRCRLDDEDRASGDPETRGRVVLNRLARRIRTRALRSVHGIMARPILRAAPVRAGATPCTVLTMVGHRDIIPYLVAIKTFAHHADPVGIAVLCDESITAADRATMKSHVPAVEFMDIRAFRSPGIPIGGCWERLLAVTELAKTRYVVQLDSDTVTTGETIEVIDAVRSGSAFVMGKEPSQRIGSLGDLCEKTAVHAGMLDSMHIHNAAQYHVSRVGLDSSMRYTDGWASFTGFPRDVTLQSRLFDVVHRLRSAMGSGLDEWGTEMVASNFLVANAAGATVLPFPKYCTPVHGETEVHLWHFVGSLRYDDLRYIRTSVAGVRSLRGGCRRG